MEDTDQTTSTQPASGDHTTNGVPHGYSTITPFVCVADPAGALDFYTRVFDARVVNATRIADALVHAELDLGHGRLQLGAPQPDLGLRGLDPTGATASFSLAIYVPHVDDVVAAAMSAGATAREPVATFVSGDRYASIVDPFGVRWTIMTRVEDLSDDESARRVEEWALTQTAG